MTAAVDLDFFHAVLARCPAPSARRLVVVTHMVPGTDAFLLATNQKMPVALVIPKPNSINQSVAERVGGKLHVHNTTRHSIQTCSAELMDLIAQRTGGERFAIMDIGGYFAPLIAPLRDRFGARIAGIVEDTENGHQRYEAALHELRQQGHAGFLFPVVSAARSTLKEPEDFLVGQAIVFSADALLRETGEIMNGKRALVFGYGKIGSSIARHLHAKGVRVDVYDTNPVRQVLALCHGFHTGDRTELLRRAELIFCATGNQSIRASDIDQIRSRACMFAATSGDDEIEDHQQLLLRAETHPNKNIAVVKNRDGYFHLFNRGNAANFLHGGVVGPYIKLVQAELLLGVSCLDGAPVDRIVEIENESKQFIADTWMRLFSQ